jgi:Fibronectin type III domain/Abnormal spindle-like microcephaly-assoc'd, ASPM-SPD-2-Hydin
VTAIIDVEAPSIPAAVTAAAPDLRGRDILVSWEESTDNVGVTGYTIYRDGVAVATVNGETLSYLDAALPAETYTYTVDAVDSAGNRSAQSAAATEAVANDPPLAPISLIGFPARDFASAEGLADTDGPVVFSLYRGGVLVSSSEPIAPAGGLAEVNHVGGGCWVTQTPDIRPGDILRVTDSRGVPHQTIMAGVQAGRPIQISANTVIIRGTAMDAEGDPLPIGEIEQRLVSGGNNFTLSGSRTLRAPGNGTLTYDSPGSTSWTATYTGLSAADLTRAHAAESRIQWLGRNALAGNELTIYENGVGTLGGPEAGFCTAPLEGNVALAGLSATSVAFGDQPAVPATTSAPRAVTLTNAGPATLRLSSVYIGQANPGDFAIASNSCPDSLDSLESCTIQITFTPSAVGARSATLNFLDNAANTSYQTIALTGSGVDAAAPSAPGAPAQALQLSGIVGGQAPMLVSWAASSGPLTSYELQRSANGGAFSSVALAAPTATSQIVMLTPGSSYRFRVRACSGASCSAWATGVNANLIGAQENNAAVKYNGTWTNQAVTGAYGGSVRFGATSGLRATYKATYTRAAWVTTRGPNRGRAQVLIDGVVVATIDLYAPTVQAGQIVFLSNALTANRTHEITILPLGTRNAASTGNRVDVDGFIGIQ